MTHGVDRATDEADDPKGGTLRQARVTFVISGLVVGGAERVLTSLANYWAATRPISIVTLDGPALAPFFAVDPRVIVQRTGLAGVSHNRFEAIINNIRRLVGLRRAIARTHPDVVVSFMDRTNVLTLLATIRTRPHVIVAERTARDPKTGRIWRVLRRVAYRRAKWIVVQTHASAQVMPNDLRARTITIPNPVLQPSGGAVESADIEADAMLVVSIGRLVPQKGFDLLIDAFVGVVQQVPGAHLEIWGAGPEAERLAARIAATSLDRSVSLCGETRDPASAIRRSALVALPSRVEGFPNVLLEAMSLGRPVVSFDCPFGPAEIIRDGVDGYLVSAGDVAALADAVVAMLSSPSARATMAANAVEVRDRFAFSSIVGSWERIVDDPGRQQVP